MARKFLTPIDMSGLEIQNVKLQSLSSDPTGAEARIYWNSVSKVVRYYDGTAWQTVSSGLDAEGVQDIIGAAITAGANISATYDDSAGTVTIAVTGLDSGDLSDFTEAVQDAVGAFVVGGSAVTATYNDGANTLTLDIAVDNSSIEVSSDQIRVKASGITNDMLAGSINLNKLATDPLARANHTGTQTASTISDFDTQVRTNRLDQLANPTASVSLNSQKITNLADPSSAQDAATKAYVDAVKTGLDVKNSVRVATTANMTLENEQTVDGVVLVAGDRVLVKNQSTGSQNGIYVVVDGGAWTRSSDADSSNEVSGGMFTFVEEGTTNADSGWVLTNNGTITVGTTALTFAQFSGAGQVTAGNGLTKTGNTIDAVGTADRITVNADSIDIASTYVGQSTITTLGTITTGVWNGTDVAVADGGTGASTAAGAKTNLGFMTRYATDVGDGSSTSIALTHGLGTLDVSVSVYQKSNGADVECDVVRTDTNTVTLSFAVAPALNTYRCVIIG